MDDLTKKIELMKMKVEILKLKANDHDWQCYIPDETKKELLDTLEQINKELKNER